MKYVKIINTIIGKIFIIEENNEIVEIKIGDNEGENLERKNTALLEKTARQLKEYFSGQRKKFDVPLNPKGTEFMKKVWTALQKIPYGEVKSYKQIAEMIGSSKAYRAVGMANHNNPIPIIIPCHRVIGHNGEMVGYALGIHIKETLLEMEKQNV